MICVDPEGGKAEGQGRERAGEKEKAEQIVRVASQLNTDRFSILCNFSLDDPLIS